MRRPPTDKEAKFLLFVAFTTNDRHYPSVREIADHMGFTSTSTVDYYIKRLVEAGHIGRVPNQPRAIWVIP